VIFDLDLDLEHTLDAGLPGDHRVQVWSRSGHLPGRRSDLRKSLQTDRRTDRRRKPRHCISSFLEWAKTNNRDGTLIIKLSRLVITESNICTPPSVGVDRRNSNRKHVIDLTRLLLPVYNGLTVTSLCLWSWTWRRRLRSLRSRLR